MIDIAGNGRMQMDGILHGFSLGLRRRSVFGLSRLRGLIICDKPGLRKWH